MKKTIFSLLICGLVSLVSEARNLNEGVVTDNIVGIRQLKYAQPDAGSYRFHSNPFSKIDSVSNKYDVTDIHIMFLGNYYTQSPYSDISITDYENPFSGTTLPTTTKYKTYNEPKGVVINNVLVEKNSFIFDNLTLLGFMKNRKNKNFSFVTTNFGEYKSDTRREFTSVSEFGDCYFKTPCENDIDLTDIKIYNPDGTLFINTDPNYSYSSSVAIIMCQEASNEEFGFFWAKGYWIDENEGRKVHKNEWIIKGKIGLIITTGFKNTNTNKIIKICEP